MIVLGISPLDKDANASLVVDGKIVFAAGEERFSRQKQHSGFPEHAIGAALRYAGLSAKDVDAVAYAFLPAEKEAELIAGCVADDGAFHAGRRDPGLDQALREADRAMRLRNRVGE